jgi:hypothetical protein
MRAPVCGRTGRTISAASSERRPAREHSRREVEWCPPGNALKEKNALWQKRMRPITSAAAMRHLLALAVFAGAMMACTGTNEQDARRALEKTGFSDIQLSGVTANTCTANGTGFEATDPWGARHSGIVCGGLTGRVYYVSICTVVQTVGGFTFAWNCTSTPFGGPVTIDRSRSSSASSRIYGPGVSRLRPAPRWAGVRRFA